MAPHRRLGASSDARVKGICTADGTVLVGNVMRSIQAAVPTARQKTITTPRNQMQALAQAMTFDADEGFGFLMQPAVGAWRRPPV